MVESVPQEDSICIIMVDEIKVKAGPSYDPVANKILGLCREHCRSFGLSLNTFEEIESISSGIKSGEVHFATEVIQTFAGITCLE